MSIDLEADLPSSVRHAADAVRHSLGAELKAEIRVRRDAAQVNRALADAGREATRHPAEEAFVLERNQNGFSVTGATARACIYGLFFIEEQILAGDAAGLPASTLRVPYFRERAGGILRFAQDTPPDFDPREYACWLARHGINFNGLHTGETNLTSEAAAAFEVDCMIGASSNFFFHQHGSEALQATEAAQAERWEREHTGSVLRTQPRPHNGETMPVLSVFTEFGRRKHREFLEALLATNARATRLLFTFGDWGSIHGDGCPVVGALPQHERVIRWLVEIDALARELRPGTKIIARTWYYPVEFIDAMIGQTPAGIGIRQKEPATICLDKPLGWELELDNYSDIMVNKFELSAKFGPVYLSGGKRRGADFYGAVGMGDTDESIDPAIGIATPWLAARKLRRLADEGIVNFHVWWGGLNYGAYSPNHEVIRAFIWDPFQDADACIERIARRDFGAEQAGKTVAFWRSVNDALEGWDYVNWKQQLETFIGRSDDLFFQPITEKLIRGNKWCGHMRPNAALLLPSQKKVVANLTDAIALVRGVHAALSHPDAKERARQQLGWTWLLRNLLRGEYHYLEAILICRGESAAALEHPDLAMIQRAEEANALDTEAALRLIGRADFKWISWGPSTLEASLEKLHRKTGG